ncbi:hypothetical protein O7634_18280 [Micromonospora sp. WMMD1120]|uniref:hypothetical protein n=1 Tax=Micromonospora sp. WMMD1120 TaxID=3016106 RepID=UPI002416D772|nr:hypothetical protein [Micromonospora sp. WMMD1120]MDG4808698.1 hypothetical protein [Micromonospora sp. WMMD1120]
MSTDYLRELLVRQLATWLPTALRRSRRATVALAGVDAEVAEAVLRLVGGHADHLRGRQLTLVVLADGAPELPTRLGPVEAELPAEVTVHLLPGDPGRLPVAIKAAGAAGAPLFSFVDLPGAVPPALLTAAANGRAGELLLRTDRSARAALVAAGFPLVAEVTPVLPADASIGLLAHASRSDRSLEVVRDALWTVGAAFDVGYRDPSGASVDVSGTPDLEPLARELLAELRRGGSRPVTELRRHTVTATVYRAAHANQALTDLLDAGEVRRDRDAGRLAGDELITPTP